MRALKGVVVILGVLIVGMMTVIGYGLYRKAEDPDFRFFALTGPPTAQPVAPEVPVAAPLRAFGRSAVPLADADRIDGMAAEGSRLLIRITRADGARDIVVVDLDTGDVLGVIELRPIP